MKKVFAAIGVLILTPALCAPAAAIPGLDFENPIYAAIKSEIIRQASDILKREVYVGEVSGNLLNSVTVKDIRVARHKKLSEGAVIRIREAKVFYNVFKAAAARDVIAALTRIELNDPDVYLEHERDRSWNLAKLVPQEGPAGEPPPFRARILVRNGKIRYTDDIGYGEKLARRFETDLFAVNGSADFRKKNLISYKVSCISEGSTMKSDGRINLKTLRTDVKLSAKKLLLKKWIPLIGLPVLKDMDISGRTDIDLSVVTLPKMKFKSLFKVHDGSLYGRPFRGDIRVDMNDERAVIEAVPAGLCGGILRGRTTFRFSGRGRIDGKFDFSGIGISSFSGGMPGMKGSLNGTITLSGPLSDIAVEADADLKAGHILGQSVDETKLSVRLKEGDIEVNSADISSQRTKLSASGSFKKDMSFELETRAQGFKITNEDLFGGSYGMLDNFNGRISGKLDRQFFKNPVKRLFAEGKVEISKAMLGKQRIDKAKGEIVLADAVLKVNNFFLTSGSSKMEIKGSVGIEKPSDLSLRAEGIDLSDLGLLEQLLPPTARPVAGTGNVRIDIGGKIKDDDNFLRAAEGLSVTFEADIKGLEMGGQPFGEARLAFDWDNRRLELKDSYFVAGDSFVRSSGTMEPDSRINFSLDGDIDLLMLRPFLQNYAKVSGRLGFKARASGTYAAPSLESFIRASDIVYNSFDIEELSGKLLLRSGTIYLAGPAKIKQGDEEYYADASYSTRSGDLKAHLFTDRGGLRSLSEFLQMFYVEALQKAPVLEAPKGSIALRESDFALPSVRSFRGKGGYILKEPKNGFLAAWEKVAKEASSLSTVIPPMRIKADGRIGMSCTVEGKSGNYGAVFGLRAANGSVGEYDFDEAAISASYSGSVINIKRFHIKKDKGSLEAFGSINLDGPMNIKLFSKDLPVDKLDTLLGPGFDVEGKVTSGITVGGTLKSPEIKADFKVKGAGITGIELDEVRGELDYNDSSLAIKSFEMKKGRQSASIEGVLPFTDKKKINLKVDLNGENIGLLAALFKGVTWTSGTGMARFSVGGTINNPDIDGTLKLENATINMDPLRSTVYGLNADIGAVDSRFFIRKMAGTISGDRTAGKSDPFSLAGTVDISGAFGPKKQIGLSLSSANTSGGIDIPGLITGDFEIYDASIKGLLLLDPGKPNPRRPVLSARINLHDAKLRLPQGGGPGDKPLEIGFNLYVNLAKNTRLVQQDTSRAFAVDLAQINVELSAEDLEIKGSTAVPSIAGEVGIKSGSINIFGREFSIAGPTEQERFFGSNRSMIQDNVALFYGGSGADAAIPELRITAKSDVTSLGEEMSSPSSGTAGEGVSKTVIKERITVLTRITGKPFVEDKQKAVGMKFYAYKEDKTKVPAEMVPAPYDENQIRVMLLPEFVKDSLGLSKGGTSDIDTNAILVDYLNARLQSVVLGGITSGVEKALGLESFTLDYNFGRDLERYLPTRRGEYGTTDKPQFGVGFVKGFFDKIYIQLRYAQSMSQPDIMSQTSLNYQITWKLGRNYSLIYYREPISFQDPNSTYFKMMLQSQYLF